MVIWKIAICAHVRKRTKRLDFGCVGFYNKECLGGIRNKMDTVPARSPGGILLQMGVHSFRTGMYRGNRDVSCDVSLGCPLG